MMFAYGLPVEICDEYVRLGKSTASECMKRFVKVLRGCFQSTYLMQPTRCRDVGGLSVRI